MLGDRGVVLRVRFLVDSGLAAAPKWSEGPEAEELEVAGVDGALREEPESVEPQDEAEAIWL